MKKTTTKKATKTATKTTASAKAVMPKEETTTTLTPRNGVALELVQPGANTVCVAGSFNNWTPETTPLNPAGNGRWVANLNLNPGRHEYLFVVDGHWLPDPNAQEAVQNPFGGWNSVLVVSE